MLQSEKKGSEKLLLPHSSTGGESAALYAHWLSMEVPKAAMLWQCLFYGLQKVAVGSGGRGEFCHYDHLLLAQS